MQAWVYVIIPMIVIIMVVIGEEDCHDYRGWWIITDDDNFLGDNIHRRQMQMWMQMQMQKRKACYRWIHGSFGDM